MEEILHTFTEDDILLEGVRYGASGDVAIVYTHGITGSVFRPAHVRIGRALAQAGYVVVAGNNRGTGVATALAQRGGARLLGGSWFERLADSVKDIAAWIAVASSAASRIVLLGHSLGGVKAILYASERGERLSGLVLASPALRLVSRFSDPEVLRRARRAVDEGRPDELIALDPQATLVFGRLSAATLLDRASPGIDPWADGGARIARVRCPTLAFYGTEEADVGGTAELERLATLMRGRFTSAMLPGADHLYTGHESEAAAIVARWIAGAVERSEPATTNV
jgi:alpha-beta hydrolase superfamily lysophospholipase